MPKLELTNDQKNIPKTLLLCSKNKCDKNEGQPGFATKLCPFCCKIGYCCNQCLTSDLPKHMESCSNNINTVLPLNNSSSSSKNIKPPLAKPKQLALTSTPNTNVNDFLSGTDDSESSDVENISKKISSRRVSKPKSKLTKTVRYKK